MKMFEPLTMKKTTFRNRIIRSATYEGLCNENGFPTENYIRFYEAIAAKEVGAIITGFAYTSREGRAMQPNQAGMDEMAKTEHFRKMTDAVHQHNCPVFLQISHAGRQTLQEVTQSEVRGVSAKKSYYFNENPIPFSTKEVYEKIDEYVSTAELAMQSGFDGVQIHAAHGYLVHQFLLPSVNKRTDEFGIDKEYNSGIRFLGEIIKGIRKKCGEDFLILVKVSGNIDLRPKFNHQQFENLIRFLDNMKVDAIEISYGTMDHPMNIFRGDMPVDLILAKNPILKSDSALKRFINRMAVDSWYRFKQKPFTPVYNLNFAKAAKQITNIPVISVGGFRSGEEIEMAISQGFADFAGLSRPLICEPAFILKIKQNIHYKSACENCNHCAVMCDSGLPTQCYKTKKKKEELWNFSKK